MIGYRAIAYNIIYVNFIYVYLCGVCVYSM